MKIALIGYRGSGKSTIGKQLSLALNIPFLDTDHLVESKAGMSIPEIFSREGESGFRLRETIALQEALCIPNVVIATGGGIVTRSENRLLLRKADLVVYLTAPAKILIERTQGDAHRPALTTLSHEKEVLTLLQQRIPLYEELADITIDTSQYSIEGAVQTILQQISRQEKEVPCKNSLSC
jgi:shikimate kinase